MGRKKGSKKGRKKVRRDVKSRVVGGRKERKGKGRGGRKRSEKETKKKLDRRNVYLGKRVPDTGRPGLDNLTEVEGISKAIIEDYEKGRISKRTANGRFALLCNVIIPKDSKLGRKKKEAEQICREYWEYLREKA